MYVGRNRIHYSEIDSTNEELKRLFKEEELDNGTLLTADYQTGGKGQMGAGWKSSKGKNFLGTFFLNSNPVLEEVFVLNMIMSLAVKETVSEFVNGKVEIKWPNDIVVEGKKIAGILIENKLQKSVLAGVFLGLGLNVNQKFFDNLPNASSLHLLTGIVYSKDEIFYHLLKHIESYLKLLEACNLDTLKKEYEALLFRIKKPSTFKTLDNQTFSGFIEGVTDDGKLKLRLEDDVRKTYDLKELQLLY